MDELLGLGKKSWQRYESGGVAPGGPIFAALARQGINVNWLLEGEDAGPMLLNEDQRVSQEQMLRVLDGEPQAVQKRKEKFEAFASMGDQQQLSITLDAMIKDIGYTPPAVIVYALKELMYSNDLSLSGALAILRALKAVELEE